MDYKRQTAGLSVMFVLVGMVFLVSAITEKAQAVVNAHAISHVGRFNGLVWSLFAGKWILTPRIAGNEIFWATKGNAPPSVH